MTWFARDPEVSGKPDAVFSCHSESSQKHFPKETDVMNRENRFESCAHSVFRFSDPANVGKSLLDGNKDHLLHQARSEIVEQVVSMSFSNKRMLKDWNWRTPVTYILNLEENNLDYKKNSLSMSEKALRETQDTEIYTRWEKRTGGITSRRILCTKINRKSCDNAKAHFTNAGIARADEFYE